MLQVKFDQQFAVLLCLTSGRRLTPQIEATLRRVLRNVSATCGACARTAVSVHGVNHLLYQRCTVGMTCVTRRYDLPILHVGETSRVRRNSRSSSLMYAFALQWLKRLAVLVKLGSQTRICRQVLALFMHDICTTQAAQRVQCYTSGSDASSTAEY